MGKHGVIGRPASDRTGGVDFPIRRLSVRASLIDPVLGGFAAIKTDPASGVDWLKLLRNSASRRHLHIDV